MKTVFIALRGGLGNQLWQGAMALAVEDFLGVEIQYLPEFEGDSYGRSYLLDVFPGLERPCATRDDIKGVHVLDEGELISFPFEERLHHIGKILSLHDNLVLSGFWQNEHYWSEKKSLIRAGVQPLISAALQEVGAKIRAKGAIGIHVRRGEYGHHGLAKNDYYLDAIKQIRQEVGDVAALYATDEPNYSRFKFRDVSNIFPIAGNNSTPLEDFYLLSCCKHFVIANSSFSWWSAWLGERQGSIIYAPYPWCLFDATVVPVVERWRCVADSVQMQ